MWLAQTSEKVEQCVWDMVVLAAITAMGQGRRFMAATLAGDPQETRVRSVLFLERVITRVVVEFCVRLRGFAALGLPMGPGGPETPFSERDGGRAALCAA